MTTILEALLLAKEALHCPREAGINDDAITALNAAIEQMESVEPVAVVDANDDGYWADILPDRSVKVGQLLYPAPAIPEGWQPIETAPWETEVLLLGPSGYLKPHDKFFINGYRVRDWHQGDWNDATGTHLSECGWKPTHWMPLPPAPEIKP